MRVLPRRVIGCRALQLPNLDVAIHGLLAAARCTRIALAVLGRLRPHLARRTTDAAAARRIGRGAAKGTDRLARRRSRARRTDAHRIRLGRTRCRVGTRTLSGCVRHRTARDGPDVAHARRDRSCARRLDDDGRGARDIPWRVHVGKFVRSRRALPALRNLRRARLLDATRVRLRVLDGTDGADDPVPGNGVPRRGSARVPSSGVPPTSGPMQPGS